MANCFNDSPSYLFTSESVTEGHPDKICDQISDAILDAILKKDKMARVACETAVTNGIVLVLGEITTKCYIEIPKIVREVVHDIGYTKPEYGFEAQTCGVMVSLNEQSPNIAQGVDQAEEVRQKAASDPLDTLGAGDQGMMFGFACDETPELMPLPISLAQKLCLKLTEVRKQNRLPYLRPDGKSQVTVQYAYGKPKRVDAVVIAAQHDDNVSEAKLKTDIIREVVKTVVPAALCDADTKYYVNATGKFVIGGPVADTGFTGRKLLVDTYGSTARHGGGAFSGKDPTKVDRSASYYMRYVAKNLVAAGLAERLEMQVSYVIGKSQPLSVCVETFGTEKVDISTIYRMVHKYFDFRPAAIIKNLNLRRPIYRQTAANGHFGRPDLNLPWEKTDKAALIRREALGR
jgi:S-adenosylmethionine synthetase